MWLFQNPSRTGVRVQCVCIRSNVPPVQLALHTTLSCLSVVLQPLGARVVGSANSLPVTPTAVSTKVRKKLSVHPSLHSVFPKATSSHSCQTITPHSNLTSPTRYLTRHQPSHLVAQEQIYYAVKIPTASCNDAGTSAVHCAFLTISKPLYMLIWFYGTRSSKKRSPTLNPSIVSSKPALGS